jgi:hypothetical protein
MKLLVDKTASLINGKLMKMQVDLMVHGLNGAFIKLKVDVCQVDKTTSQ